MKDYMGLSNSDLTFNIDKSFIVIFGLVFFGGGLIVSIIMPFIDPKLLRIWWIWIPVIIGYGIFTKMFLDAWRQRKNFVKVDENYISLHSPGNQIEIIKWSDILEIKENNILERLILKDRYQKVIRLEYQLEKMSELLNIVAKKIPHLTKQYSQLRKFHKTNHLRLFFGISLIFMSGLTAYSWYSGFLFGALIFGGFLCFIVYSLLIEFTGMYIFDDRIALVYPLWKKEIKFSQIKNIYFKNIRGGNGKSSPSVILELLNDKEVKLNGLREGTIALFSALNNRKPVKLS